MPSLKFGSGQGSFSVVPTRRERVCVKSVAGVGPKAGEVLTSLGCSSLDSERMDAKSVVGVGSEAGEVLISMVFQV